MSSDKVTVAIRVRPFTKRDVREESLKCVFSTRSDVSVHSPSTLNEDKPIKNDFEYDLVFGDESNQADIYNSIGPDLVENSMKGFNCSMFAYGQTGSGKTYSMLGPNTADNAGVIPRFCRELFDNISKKKQENVEVSQASAITVEYPKETSWIEAATEDGYLYYYHEISGESVWDMPEELQQYRAQLSDAEAQNLKLIEAQRQANEDNNNNKDADMVFKVEVSYLEIYCEKVNDLLADPSAPAKNLKVRENPKTGPFVDGLSKSAVSTVDEILSLIERGTRSRTIAATNMNHESSRSHSILTLHLTQTVIDRAVANATDTTAKISLVDLAGSERVGKTGAQGQRLREAGNINKSLSALGSVINTLASGKSKKFVPYRDSVLTFLLKDTLGGNAKTCMLATVSAASEHYEETLSTLRYASRARKIQQKAKVNIDPNLALIGDLQSEIQRLKDELAQKEQPSVQVIESKEDLWEKAALKIQNAVRRNTILKLQQQWSNKVDESKRQSRSFAKSLRMIGVGEVDSDEEELPENFPYLVNLHPDPQFNAQLRYPIAPGSIVLGSSGNIRLVGPTILEKHCHIDYEDGMATITACKSEATVFVCGSEISDGLPPETPCMLRHGSKIIVGGKYVFAFVYPDEGDESKWTKWEGTIEDIYDNYSADDVNLSSPIRNALVELGKLPKSPETKTEEDDQLKRRFDQLNAELLKYKAKAAATEAVVKMQLRQTELQSQKERQMREVEFKEEENFYKNEILLLKQQHEQKMNDLKGAQDELKARGADFAQLQEAEKLKEQQKQELEKQLLQRINANEDKLKEVQSAREMELTRLKEEMARDRQEAERQMAELREKADREKEEALRLQANQQLKKKIVLDSIRRRAECVDVAAEISPKSITEDEEAEEDDDDDEDDENSMSIEVEERLQAQQDEIEMLRAQLKQLTTPTAADTETTNDNNNDDEEEGEVVYENENTEFVDVVDEESIEDYETQSTVDVAEMFEELTDESDAMSSGLSELVNELQLLPETGSRRSHGAKLYSQRNVISSITTEYSRCSLLCQQAIAIGMALALPIDCTVLLRSDLGSSEERINYTPQQWINSAEDKVYVQIFYKALVNSKHGISVMLSAIEFEEFVEELYQIYTVAVKDPSKGYKPVLSSIIPSRDFPVASGYVFLRPLLYGREVYERLPLITDSGIAMGFLDARTEINTVEIGEIAEITVDLGNLYIASITFPELSSNFRCKLDLFGLETRSCSLTPFGIKDVSSAEQFALADENVEVPEHYSFSWNTNIEITPEFLHFLQHNALCAQLVMSTDLDETIVEDDDDDEHHENIDNEDLPPPVLPPRRVSRVHSIVEDNDGNDKRKTPISQRNRALLTMQRRKLVTSLEVPQPTRSSLGTSIKINHSFFVAFDIKRQQPNTMEFVDVELQSDPALAGGANSGSVFYIFPREQRRLLLTIVQTDDLPFSLESCSTVRIGRLRSTIPGVPACSFCKSMSLVSAELVPSRRMLQLELSWRGDMNDEAPALARISAKGERIFATVNIELFLTGVSKPVLLKTAAIFKVVEQNYFGNVKRSLRRKARALTPGQRLSLTGTFYGVKIARDENLLVRLCSIVRQRQSERELCDEFVRRHKQDQSHRFAMEMGLTEAIEQEFQPFEINVSAKRWPWMGLSDDCLSAADLECVDIRALRGGASGVSEMSGYLLKKRARFKGWIRRWFILKMPLLMQFKTPQDATIENWRPSSVLDVSACWIAREPSDPLVFRLVGSPPDLSVWNLQANNPVDIDGWLNALRAFEVPFEAMETVASS